MSHSLLYEMCHFVREMATFGRKNMKGNVHDPHPKCEQKCKPTPNERMCMQKKSE